MHCCCRHLFATAGVLCTSAEYRTHALLSPTFRRRCSIQAAAQPAAAGVEFVATLERATVADAEDEALWKSGVFDAEVHPDLPPAGTMAGLVRFYSRKAKQAVLEMKPRAKHTTSAGGSKLETTPVSDADVVGRKLTADECRSGYLVRTVPVQISQEKELRRRLAAAAGVDSQGATLQSVRPADALLLVSGSHPGRRLPFSKRFLPDVYDELRLATSMRNSGHLPKRLALWAVANPLAEADKVGVDRLRKKVELGAEVIVTQPPLVWEPFERWLKDVHAGGALRRCAPTRNDAMAKPREETEATTSLNETAGSSGSSGGERSFRHTFAAAGRGGVEARVLVGMPVITSPKGLGFWLDLCDLRNKPDVCRQAFEAFGHSPPTVGRAGAQQPQPRGVQEVKTAIAKSPTSSSTCNATLPSPYGQEWFEATMSKLRSIHGSSLGVAGVHLMPVGPAPTRRARDLAGRGVFGAPR